MILGGPASPKLSKRLSLELHTFLLTPEIKRFPDGEIYIRLPGELKGKEVVVVQSLGPPQNENLMVLLLMLDAARDLGAKKVVCVTPYFCYARQDKRFKPGEAISMKTIVKLIEEVAPDELITIDIHEDSSLRYFSIPVKNLTAMPLLGKFIGSRLRLKNPVVIGGDQGSEERAKKVAEEIGGGHDYLVKRRITPTKVTVEPKKIDAKGRDVIIVDDIISTGGTVIKAVKVLSRQGARNIYAACTHPVLVGKTLEKLRKAGTRKVIATDTIEREVSLVSVAPLIAQALR
ncbi:MAG: ribose-phosphate diphosphokinase [Candidatus Hadarchaeales archaeon]